MGVVGSIFNDTIGSVFGGTIGAFFDAAGKWAADGAVWILGQVGQVMTATTSIDLGASWFTGHERVMAVLAATLAVPMLCCTAMLAVYRQDLSLLLRTMFVQVPLALLLTGVAVELVRLGLAITDQLSSTVLASGGTDTRNFLAPVASAVAAVSPGAPGAAPAFVVFVGALLVTMASLLLWLELIVRSAAVAAATLFLPLALIGLVWPAVSHWGRRLADTIAALVLSKLVIAAVLSLAAGALAGGAASIGQGNVSSGFAVIMTGIALLFVATTAPFVLLRLVPAIEAGAVLHLESVRRHMTATASGALERGSIALEMASGAGSAPAVAGMALGHGGDGGQSDGWTMPPLLVGDAGSRAPMPATTSFERTYPSDEVDGAHGDGADPPGVRGNDER